MVNWSAVTSASDLLALPNQNTGGGFWLGMLFMVFFILILLFANFGVEIAIVTSAFICLIMGIFLVYMNLMAWSYCLIFAGIIALAILYIMWTKKAEY